MSTRLKWTRVGLQVICETSTRALPKTARAWALPPFTEINTVSPLISAALVNDPITGVVTGIRITSLEPLPAGFAWALYWVGYRGAEPTPVPWVGISLGSIVNVNYTLPEPLPGATHRFYLSRSSAEGVVSYAEVTISTPDEVAPGPITGLTTVSSAGQSLLQWDRLPDQRGIEYEIRMGSSFSTAKVVSRTVNYWAPTISDGTYWVVARYKGLYGTPASIIATGTTLLKNVVQTWDEKGTSWPGTRTGDCIITSSSLTLTPGTSLGYYEVSAGHIVDIGTSQICTVSAAYVFLGAVVANDVDSWTNVDLIPDVDGGASGYSDVALEIAIAPNSGVFGAWQPFVPGQYLGRKFKLRVKLTSSDPTVAPWLTDFAWTVDMPDRIEKGTVTTSAGAATTITFATAFQVTPNVQITILNAVAGDDIFFTVAPSTTTFSYEIRNGGTRVARNTNYQALSF